MRPRWRGSIPKSITARLRDHWNSWVAMAAKVTGPSPRAWASMANDPCQPAEFIRNVVEKSSASSGPMPPMSRTASVRTA